MLKELEDIKQFAGEPKRRWFTDEYFDLIVWQDESAEIVEKILQFTVYPGDSENPDTE